MLVTGKSHPNRTTLSYAIEPRQRHCVEDSQVPSAGTITDRIPVSWRIHTKQRNQALMVDVDFAKW